MFESVIYRNSVIVYANKCGSRVLTNYFNTIKLDIKKPYENAEGEIPEILHTHYASRSQHRVDEYFPQLFDSSYHKYLIYRYPLDRFIGWYATFIPNEVETYNSHYTTMFKLARMCYQPHLSLIDNCYNFVTKQKNIKEMLHNDVHTVPLYSYFTITQEPIESYIVVPLEHLSIFLWSYFKINVLPKDIENSNKPFVFNALNVSKLNILNEMFCDMYPEDSTTLFEQSTKFKLEFYDTRIRG